MPLAAAREMPPHGTAAGFGAGCRSRGGCPNHGSPVLTCVEADSARRSDFSIARLPIDEPVRREALVSPRSPRTVPAQPRASRVSKPATASGNRRRDRRVTDEAAHGTTTGYLKGCRRHEDCPRGQDGASCHQVRNRSRRALARRRGVASKPPPVDALPALERIAELKDAGVSLRTIAKLCGVGRTTITNIACGATVVVRRDTLERIMALSGSAVAHPSFQAVSSVSKVGNGEIAGEAHGRSDVGLRAG